MTPPTGHADTPLHEEHHSVTGSGQRPRPARQHRSGAGAVTVPNAWSSWGVPVALVILSLIPLIAGSLRVLEIAGGPHLLPANPRIDASVSSGWVINAAVAEWVIRRPSTHRVRRGRTKTALVGSR
jgi:hypothetical protein